MLNGIRRTRWVLVFPNMHDNPAQAVKLLVFLTIACDIAGELGLPPVTVVPRQDAVVRACVPEAAVYEHGHARAGQRDVRATGQSRIVNSEAQAAPVQFMADQNLRPGRSARHPLHLRRERGAERYRTPTGLRHDANHQPGVKAQSGRFPRADMTIAVSAHICSALRNGIDEALIAEKGDGPACRSAGYLPGFDHL